MRRWLYLTRCGGNCTWLDVEWLYLTYCGGHCTWLYVEVITPDYMWRWFYLTRCGGDPNRLVTDSTFTDLCVWHPVVWSRGVLDHADRKFKGSCQAADCSIHSLPNLPDLNLVWLQDTLRSGNIARFAYSHCLEPPTPLRYWALVSWA